MAIHTHVIFRPDDIKKNVENFHRTGYRYYLFAMHVKIILGHSNKYIVNKILYSLLQTYLFKRIPYLTLSDCYKYSVVCVGETGVN